jgi:hypothetical protein
MVKNSGKSGMHSQREKKPKAILCSTIYMEGGEYQKMRKGDKGKKVLGLIVILAIFVLEI